VRSPIQTEFLGIQTVLTALQTKLTGWTFHSFGHGGTHFLNLYVRNSFYFLVYQFGRQSEVSENCP